MFGIRRLSLRTLLSAALLATVRRPPICSLTASTTATCFLAASQNYSRALLFVVTLPFDRSRAPGRHPARVGVRRLSAIRCSSVGGQLCLPGLLAPPSLPPFLCARSCALPLSIRNANPSQPRRCSDHWPEYYTVCRSGHYDGVLKSPTA